MTLSYACRTSDHLFLAEEVPRDLEKAVRSAPAHRALFSRLQEGCFGQGELGEAVDLMFGEVLAEW